MRNKLKRILSSVLAALMLLTVLPLAVSGAGSMVTLSSTTSGGNNRTAVVYGTHLYTMTATATPSIKIFDISNLSAIRNVTPTDNTDLVAPNKTCITDGKGILQVQDSYLYAVFDNEIRRYSLADPENPVLTGKFTNNVDGGEGRGMMTAFSGYLIASSPGRAASFDMTNASALTTTTQSKRFGANFAPVTSDDNYVYIAGKGASAVDTVYAISAVPNTWDGDNIHNDKIALATVSGASLADYRNKMQLEGKYLYFSDVANKKVYRIDVSTIAAGKEVQTVYAGTGLADFTVLGDMLYVHPGNAQNILTYTIAENGNVIQGGSISTVGQTNNGCIRLGITKDYLYFSDNYSVNLFKIKDYSLAMTSASKAQTLPFTITGTVLEEVGLSLQLKDNDTGRTYVLTPSRSGESWSAELTDIYNGSYTLTATVSENGESVLSKSYALNVSLSQYTQTPASFNKTVNETDVSEVQLATPSIDYNTDTVTIAGKIPMKTRIGYKEVTLTVKKPDDSTLATELQGSLGNFSFSVPLGSDPVANQDYSVTVSCEGETDAVKTFRYYGTAFLQEAVNQVNGADENTISALLFTGYTEPGSATTYGPYADALGLDYGANSDYAALGNQTAVLKALLGKSFAAVADIKAAFDTAVAAQKSREALIAQIDACTTAEQAKKLIETDTAQLGLDLTIGAYTDLGADSAAELSLYQDVVDYPGTLTEAALQNIFSADYCLLRLINTRGSSEIGAVLVKYQTELALTAANVTKYTTGLVDEVLSEVNKTLARTEESEYFTSLADVKALFESTVGSAANPQGGGTPTVNTPVGTGKNPSGGSGNLGGAVSSSNETQKKEIFSDLKNVSWAEEAINYLYKEGIINGRAEGEFAPQDSLTREEFIKMLILATGIELTEEQVNYSDVSSGAWYYRYVATAYRLGLVNGLSETEFGIGQQLTREQMAVMLDRFISYLEIATEQKNDLTFTDEISDYAKESVQRLAGAGVMNGTGDGIFDARQSASRAMGAKVLYELIKLNEGR